jgi:hypothetical protein
MCLQEIQQQNASPFFCFFFSGSIEKLTRTREESRVFRLKNDEKFPKTGSGQKSSRIRI